MRSGNPWQVKGIRPQARETAREAARRSGMSVGQWLDSVIIDSAADEGVTVAPVYADLEHDTDEPAGGLSVVQERLTELGAQIERLAQSPPPPAPAADGVTPSTPDIAEAIARLDRRMERLIDENRAATNALERKVTDVDQSVAALWRGHTLAATSDAAEIEAAAAEFATRQRELDVEFSTPGAPQPRVGPPPSAADRRFSGLEQQLRDIGERLGALGQSSAMEQQLRDIRARMDTLGQSPQLEQQLQDIGERLETLGQPSEMEEQLRDIRARMDTLGQSSQLEQQLHDIGERLETLGQPSAMEQQLRDIRARMDTLGQSSQLEQQLRAIGERIEALGQSPGLDGAIAGVRHDLAEIARALADATPRQAIEALESEVRALAARVEVGRSAGIEPSTLAGLEHGLADVREALKGVASSESLAGLEVDLKALTQKVDLIANGAADPAALNQLETAISGLREIISHVASNDALAGLTAEVRTLSDKVNVALSATGRSNDLLQTLEQRIGSIADALATMRAENAQGEAAGIDSVMSEIGRKIEHLQQSRGEAAQDGQQVFGQIEQQITKLIERLDVSEERLGHFDALEKKVADLLTHLDEVRTKQGEVRTGGAIDPAAAERLAAVDALERDVAQLKQAQSTTGRRTLDSLEIVQSTISDVVDRLAMIESSAHGAATTQPSLTSSMAAPPPPTISIKSNGPAAAVTATAAAVQPAPARASASAPLDDYVLDSSGKISFPPPTAKPVTLTAPPLVPIDSTLPPDHPLEPGTGGPRSGVASAAERIAASKAVLEPAKGAANALETKSNFILAARRAAQAAAEERSGGAATVAAMKAAAPAGKGGIRKHAKSLLVGVSVIVIIVGVLHVAVNFFKPRDPMAEAPKPQSSIVGPAAQDGASQNADTGSIVVISGGKSTTVVPGESPGGAGVLTTGNDPLGFAPASGSLGVPAKSADAADLAIEPPMAPAGGVPSTAPGVTPSVPPSAAPTVAPSAVPNAKPPDVTGSVVPPKTQTLADQAAEMATGAPLAITPPLATAPVAASAPAAVSAPAPAAVSTPAPVAVSAPVPAAVSAPAPAPAAVSATPPAAVSAAPAVTATAAIPVTIGIPGADPGLPTTVGGKTLTAAAAKGDPTAAYEIGVRYAEGRGVTANPEEAAVWFERAANAGLVPAHYRLGGLYEKGIGVKKDLPRARELYLAAAAKGNSKAMHNLAVLYAEGLDGKPDYATAAMWFRKGASYGVADSQFNLGVLYARGIGVDQNLTESFKWFALAAQQGDQDAAKKRDEVAKRLDAPALNAARLAVQSWTSELQPDDAVTVKTPPGGWDRNGAGAAAPKPKAKSRGQKPGGPGQT